MLGDPASHRAHRLERLADLGLRQRRARCRCRCGAVRQELPRARAPVRARPALPELRRGRCCRGLRRGLRLPAALDEREDVLLRDAAAAAAALDLAGVDAVLGRDARDDGRDEALAVPARVLVRRLARRLGRCRPAPAWPPRPSRRSASSPASRSRRSTRLRPAPSRARGRRRPPTARDLRALGRDHRELRADLDRLAFLDEDLGEDADAGRGHLGVDLVGRDLEQALVGGDLLADLLEPLRDRSLGDGHAHLGHDDVGLRLRLPSVRR